MNAAAATDSLKLISSKYASKLQTFIQRQHPESRSVLEEIYSTDQRALDAMINIASQNTNIKKAINVYIEKLWKQECSAKNFGDPDDESLIHNKTAFLKEIIRIFKKPEVLSRCLLFPSSKDGRIQIGEIKQHPEVMFCRIFRWPGIQKSAIQSKKCCRMNSENPKCLTRGDSDNRVCVNPYHYKSICKSKTMIWDDYCPKKAYKEKSTWIPLEDLPLHWVKLRYYEFNELVLTKSVKLINFPEDEPTGERQNLLIDSSLQRGIECSKKLSFSLTKIDSFKGVAKSKQIREGLEKGISLIRNSRSQEILLELNSPGLNVFVESFWLDFEYFKQSLSKEARVNAYKNIGKYQPIKRYVHKFHYPRADKENIDINQNHEHKNGNKYEISGNPNSDKMQHEYLVFDIRDFSDIINLNFESRYLVEHESISDGGLKPEYHHFDNAIDIDQIQEDCRINISFMKGYGQDVIFWNKDRNTFIGQSGVKIEGYKRYCVHNTPCWVNLDLQEAARICCRKMEMYKEFDEKKEEEKKKEQPQISFQHNTFKNEKAIIIENVQMNSSSSS